MSFKSLIFLLLVSIALHVESTRGATNSSENQTYKIGGYRIDGTPSVITFEPSRAIFSQKIEEIRDLREALSKGAYELLASAEVKKLLGTRDGTDEIKFDLVTTTSLGYHVLFKQYYRSGDLQIPVMGQITVNVDSQGHAMWVANNMEGAISINKDVMGRIIPASQAIDIALQEYRVRGESLPSELPRLEHARLVIRRISSEGAKNETGREGKYRDELVYAIPFTRAGAPGLAGNIVIVDAVSGKVLQFEDTATREFNSFSSSSGELVENKNSGGRALPEPLPPPISTNPVPNGPIGHPNLVRNNCYTGSGLDRFGIDRKFPISSFPGSTTIDKYYSASCDERIWIYKQDPDVNFDPDVIDSGGILKDYDSLYLTANKIFINPSVAELGFWCNQLLAYFEDRGYTHRKTLNANGNPIPIEIHAKPNAVDMELVSKGQIEPAIYNWKNAECVYGTSPQLNNDLQGNCLLRFGSGDLAQGKDGYTDPQVIAHEFFHSVTFDQIGGDSGNSLFSEYQSMNEGFSDTFAMLFSRFVVSFTEPSFLKIGEYWTYPFHYASRVFTDSENQSRGYPNLEYLRNPALVFNDQGVIGIDISFTVWHAARFLPGQEKFIHPNTYLLKQYGASLWDAHQSGTLISEWAYLMVAGEGNEGDCQVRKSPNSPGQVMPVEDWVNTPVGGNYSFAHDDEDVQERWGNLEEFFLTLIHSENISTNMSFYDLRDVMVAWANSFVKSGIWPSFNGFDAGERVQQAFALLGFGNGVESDEPHTYETIMSDSIASQNLISVGYAEGRHLPIKFHLKAGQKSYFVLNEKVYKDDVIFFTVENKSGSDNPVDIRFYADKAVDLDEKPVQGLDGANTCETKYPQGMKYQMYPAVGFCGEPLNLLDPGTPPPQSGAFALDTFWRCEFPNKPSGEICYGGSDENFQGHRMYVGVKIAKAADCQCDTDYVLTVKVQRKKKFYWDEP